MNTLKDLVQNAMPSGGGSRYARQHNPALRKRNRDRALHDFKMKNDIGYVSHLARHHRGIHKHFEMGNRSRVLGTMHDWQDEKEGLAMNGIHIKIKKASVNKK